MPGYFVHTGKFGDTLYSIPAYRMSGCEALMCHDVSRWGDWRMDFAPLYPLLEANGIVLRHCTGGGILTPGVGWVRAELFRNFTGWMTDGFRWRKRNIVEQHLAMLGRLDGPFSLPWLRCTPVKLARLVIVRSARYRPKVGRVDWGWHVRRSRGDVVFLGTAEECRSFNRDFNTRVKRVDTSDYLAAGCILAGSESVCHNQTGLGALACGLGCNCVLERCEGIADCDFWRSNFWFSSHGYYQSLGSVGVPPVDPDAAIELSQSAP